MTDVPGSVPGVRLSGSDGDAGWAAPVQPDPGGHRASGPPTGRYDGARGRAVTDRGPAPGSVPLRPLDLGDILDGTFAAIRRNPRATVGVAALLVTLQQVLSVGAELLTGELPSVNVGDNGSLVVSGTTGRVVALLVGAVVGAVLTGVIVVVVSEDVLGRRPSAAQVWRRVRPRLWALLGAAVLAGALPFVGLLLLVVPGVLLWAGWALTAPALVLEDLGPVRAVRRSWRLVRPAFWRVLGIRSLAVVLGLVMQELILVPFAFVAAVVTQAVGADPHAAVPTYSLAIETLGSIVAGTIVAPFLGGVLTLLYVDRRMRAEGFDIAIQLDRRERSAALARLAPVGGGG